ncbi:hypothetical protein [uncultured Deinococcus sp.]|uniref:hypothetical protein n=1 Tax=uncultured Deinococcus sp. TaxID=158789 RepID=UPI0025DB4E2A|nr:hypothetical protein [uncultured Deinococcus sp.]
MPEHAVPLEHVCRMLPVQSAAQLRVLMGWIDGVQCLRRTQPPLGYRLVGTPGPHTVSTSVHGALGPALVDEFRALLVEDAR